MSDPGTLQFRLASGLSSVPRRHAIAAKLAEWRQGAKRRRSSQPSKGHVLFISRQRIVGPTNGSSVYLLDLAAAVRRLGFTPHLVQPSPVLMGRWPVMRLGPATRVFETHAIRGVLKLGSIVVTLDFRVVVDAALAVARRLARRTGLAVPWLQDRPRPYAVATPWTEADHAFLQRRAAGRDDILIADYAFQAPALARLAPRPCAIVMHDLFHARDGQGRDSVAWLTREAEIALLSQADVVLAIQAQEARFIADHVQARPILTPMAAAAVQRPQPGDAHRLLFVGSNTAPNVVALEWLFAHVWPQLLSRNPAVRLDVAGTVSAGFPAGGPSGVTFHGRVASLDAFYETAGIVISPLTFGSGLKIKLVDALAQGKAIVATSTTLQGVERECEGAVIQADTPAEFLAGILDLADDPRRASLAAAALEAARTHFSPEACHAGFAAWLHEVRPQSGRSTLRPHAA